MFPAGNGMGRLVNFNSVFSTTKRSKYIDPPGKDETPSTPPVSRRSVTGILLLVGKTPVYAKSSRQKAVTSSTFSRAFMALRTGCEYILGLRFLLRSLGVAVTEPTRVLGDNRGVVDNATVFTSCLKKKHNAISYVRVRECVAAGVIDLKHVSTDENLADVLTKGLPADKLNKLRDSIMH